MVHAVANFEERLLYGLRWTSGLRTWYLDGRRGVGERPLRDSVLSTRFWDINPD
jgi:hypothetical protein